MKYIIITLYLFSCIYSQQITFPKEDITFVIDASYLIVNGNYYFRNNANHPTEQKIFYPFPNESEFGFVDSVEVFDLTNYRTIKSKTDRSGLLFYLDIEDMDSLLIHIYYRQKIISDSVKYILTTTKFWNKPFDVAEYKLIVDPAIEITKFSYNPDKEYLIDGKTIYYWKKENFMPDRDMIYHLRRKGSL